MKRIILFLLYFMLFSSFMAAQIFTIDLRFFQLSLYRISLLMVISLLIVFSLKSERSIKIVLKGENTYSLKFHLFWLLYAGLSLIWVKDFQLWIRTMYFLFSGIISILLCSMLLTNKKYIIRAFYIMGLMIVIHNIVGWYEIFTQNYHFISASNQFYYSTYLYRIPISFAGNPNDFAMIVTFGVGIIYICYKNTTKFINKFFFLLVIISSIILIFMTQSRALLIAFFLGVLFYILFELKSHNSLKKIVMAVVIVIIIFFLVTNTLFTEYLSTFFRFNFSASTGSEANRIALIKNGLIFFIYTLGFGTGAGNIEYWMENRAIYPTGGAFNMHNWWFELLAGYGLIVFILYIIFYKKLFRSMLKIYKESVDKQYRNISFGIMYCMIAYIIGSISSSSNINSEWIWLFWGVAIAFQGLTNDSIMSSENV